MTYTGTLLRELQSVVEACLDRNRRICANCGQRYIDHCEIGGHCPDFSSADSPYLSTRFSEQCFQVTALVTQPTTSYEGKSFPR